MLSDQEIISKFKLKGSDKILDVGGAMKQHKDIKIDTLVDIIRPEEAPYGVSKLLAKKFVRIDITKDKLPFADDYFDFCLCTHTLEDLYNPFLILDEMSRVAKMGYIATPSMGQDMVFGAVDTTNWLSGAVRVPGLAHHKWFFQKRKDGLLIIPKNYGILYSGDFHFVHWLGEDEMQYEWIGKIIFNQIPDLNAHELVDEYQKYVARNKNKLEKGRALVYLDNPVNLLKAILKPIFKKGKGYKYRKIFR